MSGAVRTNPRIKQIPTNAPVTTMLIAKDPVQYPCSFSNFSEHFGQLTLGLKNFMCVFLHPHLGQAFVKPRQINVDLDFGNS